MMVKQRKLFVVLEGMFVFFEDQTQVEAQVVNLGVEHVYLAGDWLCETDLVQGNYVLQGVSAQNYHDRFHSASNLIFSHVQRSDGSGNARHSTLTFPERPAKIHSLFKHHYDPNYFFFSPKYKPAAGTQGIASVQVFEYILAERDNPQLTMTTVGRGGHHMDAVHWKARSSADGPSNVVLHLRAEPPMPMEGPPADAHILRAWNTGTLLFNSLGAVMLTPFQDDPSEYCAPSELLPGEFLDLASRKTTVCTLGILTREIFASGGSVADFCKALAGHWPPPGPGVPVNTKRPGCTMGAISSTL